MKKQLVDMEEIRLTKMYKGFAIAEFVTLIVTLAVGAVLVLFNFGPTYDEVNQVFIEASATAALWHVILSIVYFTGMAYLLVYNIAFFVLKFRDRKVKKDTLVTKQEKTEALAPAVVEPVTVAAAEPVKTAAKAPAAKKPAAAKTTATATKKPAATAKKTTK